MVLYDILKKASLTDIKNADYLWLDDMEWTENNAASGEALLYTFALSGAGDSWNICTSERHYGKIILKYHDDGECIVYAESLQAAIFRRILEFLSGVTVSTADKAGSEYSRDEMAAIINAWIKLFEAKSDFFAAEWTSELKKAAKSNLKTENTVHGLITERKANSLIKKHLPSEITDFYYDPETDEISEPQKAEDANKKIIASADLDFRFSDEEINKLAEDCRIEFHQYKNSFEKLYAEAKGRTGLETLIFKSLHTGADDFIYPLADRLQEGKFYSGKPAESIEECRGNYCIYYTDSQTKRLVYKEEFSKDELIQLVFYSYIDEKRILKAYSYSSDSDNELVSIEENKYDGSGRIIGYIDNWGSDIVLCEKLFYENGRLTGCDSFRDMSLDLPAEKKGAKRSDGTTAEGNNPASIFRYKFYHKNGKLKKMNYTRESARGLNGERLDEKIIISSDFDISEKVLKELEKKPKLPPGWHD